MATYRYTFELLATGSIEAKTKAEARRKIAKAFGHMQDGGAAVNGGAWPNGDPVLFDLAPLDGDDALYVEKED